MGKSEVGVDYDAVGLYSQDVVKTLNQFDMDHSDQKSLVEQLNQIFSGSGASANGELRTRILTALSQHQANLNDLKNVVIQQLARDGDFSATDKAIAGMFGGVD